MAALLAFLPAAGHDQLWFLLMARRWLAGATLYGPEIFDSNPPCIIWLSAVPVVLAGLLHLPATLVAKMLVLLGTALSGLFSYRLLPRVWRPMQQTERPALLFAFISLAFVLPARDLGQRDALAGIFALPYVLAAIRGPAQRDARKPDRTFAVLLAALAFCLKPQDALIAVAVELSRFVLTCRRARSFRTAGAELIARFEIPVLLVCGSLYLLAIHRFAPLYLSSALPILRETYWAIGHLSLPQLLWEGVELFTLAAFTLFLLLRFPPSSTAPTMLYLAGCGALLAYLLQGTGWYYQQLPALTLIGAALVLHLLDLAQRAPFQPPTWCARAVAGLCLLAIALTTHFTGYPFTPDRAFALTTPDPRLFRNLAPGTPIAILTTSVDQAMMPIERFHLTWAQRNNNLRLLPAILRSETLRSADPRRRLSPLQLAHLRVTQQSWMVADLQRWRPQLILVERCTDPATTCQELEGRRDDLLAWFERDPAFVAEWTHYRFLETRDRFDAYVLSSENCASLLAPYNGA